MTSSSASCEIDDDDDGALPLSVVDDTISDGAYAEALSDTERLSLTRRCVHGAWPGGCELVSECDLFLSSS